MAKHATAEKKAKGQDKKAKWRGINVRMGRAASLSSQESRVTVGSGDSVSALSVNIRRIESDDSSDSSESELEIGPPSPIEESRPTSPLTDSSKSYTNTVGNTRKKMVDANDETRSRASSSAASEVFQDAYDEHDSDDSVEYPAQTTVQGDMSRKQITNMSMILPALKYSEGNGGKNEKMSSSSQEDNGDHVRPARPVYDAMAGSKSIQAKQLGNQQSDDGLAAEIQALEIAAANIPTLNSPQYRVAQHPVREKMAQVSIFSTPDPVSPTSARMVTSATEHSLAETLVTKGQTDKIITSNSKEDGHLTSETSVHTNVQNSPKSKNSTSQQDDTRITGVFMGITTPSTTFWNTITGKTRKNDGNMSEITSEHKKNEKHVVDAALPNHPDGKPIRLEKRSDDRLTVEDIKNRNDIDQSEAHQKIESLGYSASNQKNSSAIEAHIQKVLDNDYRDIEIIPEKEPIPPRVLSENRNDTQAEERPPTPERDCLGAILPAMEEAARDMHANGKLKNEKKGEPMSQTYHRKRSEQSQSQEYHYSDEDSIDLDIFKDNVITVQNIDTKTIPINNLTAREQEEADEPLREAIRHLFSNRFMKAKSIFQSKASIDPLYALGLGAMAFIKAIMTYDESDAQVAMSALATSYTIAKAQVDSTAVKRSFKDTFSQYFSSFMTNSTGLPSTPTAPSTSVNRDGSFSEESKFLPNGVLRAYVIKAESCLLMGMLQMIQENVVGYLKCGLNLRRAYSSYAIVWQEYKRMGQSYTKYMDRDTVSAVQFGIGSVHLLLSSLPAKILKIFSTLGWKSDRQLGFALLKLCMEGKGIRAPLASLMLLSYYSILTSFAPQVYSKELLSPAVECLLEAQKSYPSSCFFLYFAARIARVARNLPLSTQSFSFALDSSRGEWAEVAMKHMTMFEIGWNNSLQLDWAGAEANFGELSEEKYWSPVFCTYFLGACREMRGKRTEGILAFAQIPQLAKEQQTPKTYLEAYILKKVEFFQRSGYQDMDMNLPALEILLLWNAYEQMEPEALESCLTHVENALGLINERETQEYNIRLRELVPASSPPNFYDQRAVLLLIKAAVLNALKRYNDSIVHLNWVMDHKQFIKMETWVLPFTYWEAGVTSWGLGNYGKSRKLWQQGLACSKYDFEYRMAVRLNLALSKCDEMGVSYIEEKEPTGLSTNGRKRMPIAHT